jgi:uncharacterized membrane protein YdbT with pleckstrin-like domain
MSYVERVLAPGEQVTYRGRLHWILYGSAAVPALVAVGFTVGASLMADGTPRRLVLLLAGAALLAALAQALGVWLRIGTTEIAVTSRRIIFKTGLVSRRSIEMNLDKVESVIVDQDPLGRLFDYGAVVIRGVGAGLEPVRFVAAPLEFRRRVLLDFGNSATNCSPGLTV